MTNKKQKTLESKNIADNLYSLREEKGLSHEALAEVLDLSARIIYDYESGKKKPSLETLIAIVNYFGVTFEDILQTK